VRSSLSTYFKGKAPVSHFVLKPARLLQTRLVTSKTDPAFELDFKQLVQRFVSPNAINERLKLLNLRHGMFLGLSRSKLRPGGKCIFVLFNIDRGGNIDFVLKRDPSFEQRLLESYFVESAEYDAKLSEKQEKVA
jgi:hypothetical protein